MAFEDNFSAWEQVLNTPQGKAALLQFSAQMLMPSNSGFMGALGKSMGAAGEAAGRVTQQQQAQQTQKSEEEQRQFERKQSESRLKQSERQLDIAQQNADTAARNAARAGQQGLTYADRVKLEFDAMKTAYEAKVENSALNGIDPGPPPTLADAEAAVRKGQAQDLLRSEGFTPRTKQALRAAGIDEQTINNAERVAKGAGAVQPGMPGAPAVAAPPTVGGGAPKSPDEKGGYPRRTFSEDSQFYVMPRN